MFRTFVVGFLGAIAALMVAAAVWFAVFQPLDRPGLVWGGSVYYSKQEFKLYLRTKSLSYATWLRRNPGVAPWEPGTRAVKADEQRPVWDWKRDALLTLIAALLATIAATLLATREAVRPAVVPGLPARDRLLVSPAAAAARTTGHGLGYIKLGAGQLIEAGTEWLHSTPGRQHEVVVMAFAGGLAVVLGLLATFLLAG